MSEARLEQLTFGIEIEFILAHPPLSYNYGTPETADMMRNRYIREPLRAAGLRVDDQEHACQLPGQDPKQINEKWLITDDKSVVVTPADLEIANGTLPTAGSSWRWGRLSIQTSRLFRL